MSELINTNFPVLEIKPFSCKKLYTINDKENTPYHHVKYIHIQNCIHNWKDTVNNCNTGGMGPSLTE